MRWPALLAKRVSFHGPNQVDSGYLERCVHKDAEAESGSVVLSQGQIYPTGDI